MYETKAYKDSLTLGNKLRRAFWNICRILFFYPFYGPLFWRWRIFVLKIFGMKIGKGCKISNSAKIWAPWNVEMEQYVAIGPHTKVYSVDKIVLGEKITVSQGAYLCSASHDISYRNKPLIHKPIRINSYAWICTEAFVGMGVTIGEGAVVGARAVVTKDVEPWTVVAGNPAKFIKKREIKDA